MSCCGKITQIVQGYAAVVTGKEYEFSAGRIRCCQTCDKNYWIGKQLWCSICKCWIPAAARATDKECPLDRWPDRKGVMKNGE